MQELKRCAGKLHVQTEPTEKNPQCMTVLPRGYLSEGFFSQGFAIIHWESQLRKKYIDIFYVATFLPTPTTSNSLFPPLAPRPPAKRADPSSGASTTKPVITRVDCSSLPLREFPFQTRGLKWRTQSKALCFLSFQSQFQACLLRRQVPRSYKELTSKEACKGLQSPLGFRGGGGGGGRKESSKSSLR